ncbi:ATP-binding protein [Actinomadura adrarensis]|uniref:ATP-binding protein n=1 Tax=Actinomadura adrarensis TaxID=1819600 RepID=A0ABW3C9N6_9ACTN
MSEMNGLSAPIMEANELLWTKPASELVPGQVRALLKAFLREGQVALHLGYTDDFVSDAVLVAVELVTNAVAHTPGGERVTFRARIESAHQLWAGVWDCSPRSPVAKPMFETNGMPVLVESGRGLGIALAFADELNVTWTPPRGKWTWARFSF